MSKIFAIFGAGGFGREIMPILEDFISSQYDDNNVEIFFVERDGYSKKNVNGLTVLSEDAFLAYPADEKFYNIAAGESKLRERIHKKMEFHGVKLFDIRSKTSRIYKSSEIAEGSVFCDFTTVTANVKIGKLFQCNIYSYVAHDCIIGDYVTFAPGVKCNGNVIIKDYAYIGAGAIIRNGSENKKIIIGKNSIIGMGAVVTKDVPDNTVMVGNPAKPIIY